jgi:hypothetical protein
MRYVEDDGINGLIERRIDETAAAMHRMMTESLYGDERSGIRIEPDKPRWRRWLAERGSRCRNAWLVLTGQAYIDGDW